MFMVSWLNDMRKRHFDKYNKNTSHDGEEEQSRSSNHTLLIK